tara:strand:+ start:383 stop:490 length:108 start_codon:yes stop_codon:yes gene_type:complete
VFKKKVIIGVIMGLLHAFAELDEDKDVLEKTKEVV